MPAQAIIGANWGDEGKGLGVDALAHRDAQQGRIPVVVRSNGGAQAGHGVHTPDGRHHVFHHVGSGSFVTPRTHLSQFFVAHPMMLEREIVDLAGKGVLDLDISIDPRSPVTTPFDMAINQALEIARGGLKHGSCGMGFGETVERTEQGPGLTAADLFKPGVEARLQEILKEWVPQRLDALGVEVHHKDLWLVLEGGLDVITPFLRDLEAFTSRTRLLEDAALGGEAVIFEGAQGLQLDMDLGEFPYVTRSRTGVQNMAVIAAEAGMTEIEATYMTRAYATRHGAGPFEGDLGCAPPDWADVVDLTNRPNAWQGHIRYAPLDLPAMKRIIAADLQRSSAYGVRIDAGVGVTCVDQIAETAPIFAADSRDDGCAMVDKEDIADLIADRIGHPLRLISRGPTRETASLSRGVECAEPVVS